MAVYAALGTGEFLIAALEGFGDLAISPQHLLSEAAGRAGTSSPGAPARILSAVRAILAERNATGWARYLAVESTGSTIRVCHVGDLRCYLLQQSQVSFTVEHTFAYAPDEELPDSWAERDYRRTHPSALTRHVDASGRYEPSIEEWGATPPYSLYVCSYGYHQGRPHQEFARALPKLDIARPAPETDALLVRVDSEISPSRLSPEVMAQGTPV